VYKFDYEKKSKVANPTNCMVACITCANLCPMDAISFAEEGNTPREKARKIVSEFQLPLKVKEELGKRKDELKF
jgi:formate hydrogenlyase subunit 6/NADH:ubiquinone oxidoreductase subunit I